MASVRLSRARLQATLAWIGSCFLWLHRPKGATVCLVGAMTALALLAWVFPKGYAPVQRGFDRVTGALLKSFTWLLLGVLYFGLFTPLRGWRALRRQDPLRLRSASGVTTFFEPIPPGSPDRFDRQY